MAGYQPEKRLVVCCDGTWNDSVSTDSPLTNVSRFSRCVEAIGEDGILQIVYYHTGVGSGTSKLSNSIDGATGRGLSRNIRDAYSFICNNYNFEGGNDEIHLVGFSRGAFTVRCVASLIDSIGLLTKPGLVHLHDLYHSWEKLDNNKEDLISQVTELEEKGLLRRKIQVEACAVWDTVSALGVPIPFGIPQPKSPKLAFVDAEVPHTVKNAFHALALHERRKHFKPLLWHSPSQDHINLRQCWFWGVHSDVGGGYEDAGLANLALIWMVAQFQRATKLHFNMDTLLRFLIPDKLIESTTGRNLHISTSVFGIQYGYQERNIRIRSKIDKGEKSHSYSGAFRLMGSRLRRPGKAVRFESLRGASVPGSVQASDSASTATIASPEDRDSTGENGIPSTLEGVPLVMPPVEQTVHFTVRVMMAQGLGKCVALQDYATKLSAEPEPRVTWKLNPHLFHDKKKVARVAHCIEEDNISDEEFSILERWVRLAKEKAKVFEEHRERVVKVVRTGPMGMQLTQEVSKGESMQLLDEQAKVLSFAERLSEHLEEGRYPKLFYSARD